MRWAEETNRSVFLCDVRTEQEFLKETIPGAQHAPGGQLIQATDQFVGVRNARIVLFDSDGIRANTTASWLKQMGHDVYVLEDGLESSLDLSSNPITPIQLPLIACDELMSSISRGRAFVLDLRPSMQFRQGSIPGSQWSIRPNLSRDLKNISPEKILVVVTDDPAINYCAAIEFLRLGITAKFLSGGLMAWQKAGHSLEKSPRVPSDSECIDFLFFVHDRHNGNKESAARYLEWETGLIAQLDQQELATFCILQ
jgi:rhodanese-related sulfurtransferase